MSIESKLEDIAQLTGGIDYNDAMAISRKSNTDQQFKKQVRELIMDWEDAMEEGDDETAERIAGQIKNIVPK